MKINKPNKTLFWDPDKHYYWAPSDGEMFKLTQEGFKSTGYIRDKVFFDVDTKQYFSPHEHFYSREQSGNDSNTLLRN
jgi:hypothetical protein